MTTRHTHTERRRLFHYEIELAKARGEWQQVERLTMKYHLRRRLGCGV